MTIPPTDTYDDQDSGQDVNLLEDDDDDEEDPVDDEEQQRQLDEELLLDQQFDQQLGLDLDVPDHNDAGDGETQEDPPQQPQQPPQEEPRPASYIDRSHFDLFNLLDQPVWIFDIVKRCMWWGNQAAIELWSAENLEDLLARNFAEDMSDATKNRLDDYLLKFSQAETGTVKVTEQWVCMKLFDFCLVIVVSFLLGGC